MKQLAGPSSEETSGFTLIEVLISLVLFALISLAGISLVQTVVDVQTRTEVRGARLAEIQRALYLVGADLEQMTGVPEVQGGKIHITRSSDFGDFPVTYEFSDGALRRSSGDSSATVLNGVAGLSLRLLIDNQWTQIPQDPAGEAAPLAIEVTMMLAPRPNQPSGPVRRVVELPVLVP